MTEEEKQKVIDKAISDLNGGFTEFSGQNCDEPCQGWDGIDRRCECGNRRVCWEFSDDESYVIATAY